MNDHTEYTNYRAQDKRQSASCSPFPNPLLLHCLHAFRKLMPLGSHLISCDGSSVSIRLWAFLSRGPIHPNCKFERDGQGMFCPAPLLRLAYLPTGSLRSHFICWQDFQGERPALAHLICTDTTVYIWGSVLGNLLQYLQINSVSFNLSNL